jgi:hypothetical protein
MTRVLRSSAALLAILLASCSISSPINLWHSPISNLRNETNESSGATSTPTFSLSNTAPITRLSTTTELPQISPEPSETLDSRRPAEDWQNWPVVPNVSPWLKSLYDQGLADGNNPHNFSKIGDCQNVVSLFLPFDLQPYYRLGDQYSYLKPTIEQFKGNWMRKSEAVRGGYNVATVLSPFAYDKGELCNLDESPLACEFRLNKPSIAIISMETWTSKRPTEIYEGYLSQVVEFVLNHKAIPILATKADNIEGDHSINAAIARVAYKYDIPLWNFWAAVQNLPSKGLTEDNFHLTVGKNYFDDPTEMEKAWPIRNLTALETINAVWEVVK